MLDEGTDSPQEWAFKGNICRPIVTYLQLTALCIFICTMSAADECIRHHKNKTCKEHDGDAALAKLLWSIIMTD